MISLSKILRDHGLLFAFGAAAFFITCVAAAPASILPAIVNVKNSPAAYKSIDGTVWAGSIQKLSVNGSLIGDVDYRLSPWSLLTLSPRLQVSSQNGAVRGNGIVAVNAGGRLQIADAAFDIDLGPFAQQGVLGLPVEGEARVAVRDAVLTRRGCQRANGSIWTNVLEAPARQYRTEAFPMSGDIACEGDALTIAMSGEGAKGAANMTLRIRPDLSYELTATARSSQSNVAEALRFFGFEDSDGALKYGSTGVLRGAGS